MGAVESCCHSQQDDKMLVTKMDLSHCGFSEVPNIVFNVERCIETLILSSNRITSLPPQLFHCQELKHLNLCDNCLTGIPPAIGSLLHLVSLKLDKNNLRELPENLKTCRKLKRLSLNNNQLKQMPIVITQLIGLEELYLNDCELSYLPASVGRLSRLKILELRNNNLCNLPLSMSRLMSITRLDIGDNEFVEFPPCINNLKSLSELLIDNNDLEEITDIKNLICLEHLDASYNHLIIISETIGFCKNVIMLNLSFNYIEHIPETIGNVTQLQTFQLEMNELTEIPKSVGRLVNLEDLNVCFNRLCNVPNSIGLLRNLRNLNVSRNMIEEFPPEIGSCTKLAIVNASYNRLQVLPPEIGYLNDLKVLDVVGNFLMYLPITIVNLKGIRAIWLSANQNVPLIPFTEDVNIASGERFLTNIALPQLGEIPLRDGNVPFEKNKGEQVEKTSWTKKIRFAEDEDLLPGKLHRTPTPFPKELRAPNRKHHSRSEETRPEDNYVNVVDGKIVESELRLHPPTSPVVKSGSGLLSFTESCVTVIREANIIRNAKDSNWETDETPNLVSGSKCYPREESSENFKNDDERNGNGNARTTIEETIQRNDSGNEFPVPGGRRTMNERDFNDNGNPVEFSPTELSQKRDEQGNMCFATEKAEPVDDGRFFVTDARRNVYEVHPPNAIYHGGDRNPTEREETYELRRSGTEGYSNEKNEYLIVGNDRRRQTPDYSNRERFQPERPPSKQEMASIAERMRSQNISPPCYEIAKMYSTKAAFFERHRPPS